jgi:hypothetical protein
MPRGHAASAPGDCRELLAIQVTLAKAAQPEFLFVNRFLSGGILIKVPVNPAKTLFGGSC